MMLLSGLISMVVLACSGLYIKGYIDSKPCEESDKYFDDDIVELGIQPHIVGVVSKTSFHLHCVFPFSSPEKYKWKSITKLCAQIRDFLFANNCIRLGMS